jgi:hypothetical protein
VHQHRPQLRPPPVAQSMAAVVRPLVLYVFPIVHALAELPTYHGYDMPSRGVDIANDHAAPDERFPTHSSMRSYPCCSTPDTCCGEPSCSSPGYLVRVDHPTTPTTLPYGCGSRASRHLPAHLRADCLTRRVTGKADLLSPDGCPLGGEPGWCRTKESRGRDLRPSSS